MKTGLKVRAGSFREPQSTEKGKSGARRWEKLEERVLWVSSVLDERFQAGKKRAGGGSLKSAGERS